MYNKSYKDNISKKELDDLLKNAALLRTKPDQSPGFILISLPNIVLYLISHMALISMFHPSRIYLFQLFQR